MWSWPASIGGQPIDAGLIIHEGQLTYGDQNLHLIVDLGQWWMQETGLPLPLGANGVRKDLGTETIREVNRLLEGEHRIWPGASAAGARICACNSAATSIRGKADKFVGMYVNDWTLDFGERGREAVRQLLARGHAAGVIPKLVEPEFVA